MKKFLSLVLALIMTMSLVTIGAGATEYRDLTDKDEIQYEEAVAVLNRIGVITGYEDGSFRPETELTRGAAAKIIVSLLIGPEAASNLPNATAPYPDVPASHTFAGVISYCKTAGIISGYGDGTFKPGNSLTGFAFAKMLLGALGYKSEIEGFVDTGWTMNVARVGNVTGLFDRLDFDGSAAVNREEACQLALNTLKATMVTYGGTTLVTGAQALAVQGTQAMYVTSNNREINANINRRVISATNNEMTLEFGEEHFKDLRLEHDKYDPAYDVYGHPSDEWSWKKVTIGTFPLPADFTFTKQMAHLEDTDATKEKALGLRNYDTWSVDHRSTYSNWSSAASSNNFGYFQTNSPFADVTQIHINGWKARVNEATGKIYNYVSPKNTTAKPANAPDIAEIADLTDNGVTVEVYVCPVDADFITDVVVTRTQLMKVKRVGADTITLEDIKPDSRDPRTASDPNRKPITGFNNFAIDVTKEYDTDGKKSFLSDVKDDNYDAYNDLKDMKAGDYVAVVPYTTDEGLTWEVGEAYAPETVSGAFTKVDTYANVNKREGSAVAITVGGTSYPINEWNKDMLDVTGNKIKATKKDVTLYLAKDGTALLATEIGISDAWMIVGDYYQATGSNSKVAWFVHGWTIGGEEVDLDLGTIRGAAEKYAPGELVYYSIADGGDGEYQLSKPNNNGKSWPKNSDEDTDNGYFTEPRRSTTKNNKIVYTGEGIYDVSQYTIERAASKNNVKTTLVSRDGAIALEKYSIGAGLTDTANELTLYKTADGNIGPDGNPVKVAPHATANPHNFQYRNVPYNGVKFIFVNFDATNGNVETIEFKKGAQNVEYQDLITFNQYWANIGTNDGKNYVVTPAEAYVNDKGEVKAVVIKTDSSEADLTRVAVITDTPGDKDKDPRDTTTTEGAGAVVTYAKRYVTGPSFSMADEKTGVFDKDYAIGDILIISEKDGVIVGKKFHSNYYNNSNPDAVYVEGVGTVKRGDGKDSKIGFTIGGAGSAVYTLNKQYPLFAEGKNTSAIPGSDKVVRLLTNEKTVALDTDDDNTKGLIVVTGDTTFVDLRPINQDTIENLDDLFEYDLSTLRLRLLVNGAVNSDTFRRAYAVIVEQAYSKKDNVDTPDIAIQAIESNQYVSAKSGTGTAKDPWIFEVEAGKQVKLHGVFNNASDLAGKVESKTWVVNGRVIAPSGVSDNDSILVDAPEVIGSANGKTVTWTVTVRDDTKADLRTASSTVYAKVIIKSGVTVTMTPAGSGTIAPAAGLNVGDTFTLTPAEDYEYVSVVGATKAADSLTFTITDAAVTITMKKTGGEPPQPSGITITGEEGQTVTFKNQAGETVATATVGGDPVELPADTYLCAEAADGYYARVEKEGTPYNRYFKVENVDKIEVYATDGTKEWTDVYNADGDTIGLGKIPARAEAARAASAQEADMTAVSVQNASDSKIMISDPDSDAYLLCEPGTGLDAGMYFIKPGYTSEALKTVLKAMTAAEKEGKIGDLIEEISDERFEQGYTDKPDPVEPSETIKAVVSGGTATLYAYRGPKGTDAVELTEEQIKAALAAADVSIRELNMKTGKVTTTAGQELTLSPLPSKGVVKNPTALYKVTVPNGTVSYLKPGDKLSGLNGIKALLEKGSVVGTAVAVDAEGKSDALSPSKDIVYAEALPVFTAGQGGCPTDPAGDKSITGIAFGVFYTNKDGDQTAFSSTTAVEKGTELTFFKTGTAGDSVELFVNDKSVATGTYAANGSCTLKYTATEVDATGKLTFWVVAGGAKVSFNGQTYEAGANKKVILPSTKAGVQLAKVTSTGALAAPTGTTAAAPGGFSYEVAAADAVNGVITLVEAYPVAVAASSPKWTGFVDEKRETAIADDSGGPSFVLADGTGKIYINAETKNTTLKLADTSSDKNLVLTADSTYIPSAYQKARYVVTVNGPVAANDIVVDFKVPDEDQAAIAADNTATGAGTKPVNVTFTVAKEGFTVPANLDAEIEVDWKAEPSIATTLGSATWTPASGLVITATIKANAAASAPIGIVTVKWNGLTFDVPLEVHA